MRRPASSPNRAVYVWVIGLPSCPSPCGVCPLCISDKYIHCESIVDFHTFTEGGEGRATMAQYLLKPDWLLPIIPEDISLQHGSMACCGLGPSFGAFERMGLNSFHTVMITGLGPVGLGPVGLGAGRTRRRDQRPLPGPVYWQSTVIPGGQSERSNWVLQKSVIRGRKPLSASVNSPPASVLTVRWTAPAPWLLTAFASMPPGDAVKSPLLANAMTKRPCVSALT